jgi:ERCC4-type nuclease
MSVKKTDVYYRYNIPTLVTVQVDSREKYPMLFPATIKITHPELTHKALPIQVKVEKVTLQSGDYRLKEFPHKCVIERKASQLELYKNLSESHDRIRQAKAFRRLAGCCEYPCLIVEASPNEIMSSAKGLKHNPEIIAHRLALAVAKYGFNLWVIPFKSRVPAARRQVGAFLVHLMLGYVLHEKFDVPHTPINPLRRIC